MTGRPRLQRAFTLIELLVVMAIIGTLLMIAVPRYFSSLRKAQEATLRQDLAVMRDALDKYLGDVGQYPETLDVLVERRYLRAIPVDPFTRSAETWIIVPSDSPELAGIRDVQSGAEGTMVDGTAYSDI